MAATRVAGLCIVSLVVGYCLCIVLTERPADSLPWPLNDAARTLGAYITLARDPLGISAALEYTGIPVKTAARMSVMSIGTGFVMLVAHASGVGPLGTTLQGLRHTFHAPLLQAQNVATSQQALLHESRPNEGPLSLLTG